MCLCLYQHKEIGCLFAVFSMYRKKSANDVFHFYSFVYQHPEEKVVKMFSRFHHFVVFVYGCISLFTVSQFLFFVAQPLFVNWSIFVHVATAQCSEWLKLPHHEEFTFSVLLLCLGLIGLRRKLTDIILLNLIKALWCFFYLYKFSWCFEFHTFRVNLACLKGFSLPWV